MKSYEDIGLDSSLRKIGGIAAEKRDFTSEYKFDATTDTGIISAPKIQAGAVGSIALVDLSVTTAKLAEAAVVTSKMATVSVDSTILADLAVTAAKLAGSAVTTTKLADDAVTGPKIIGSAITAPKIDDGAVGSAQIASAAIGSAHIGTATIAQVHMGTASIGSAQVISAAIGSAHIGTASIAQAHMGTAVIGSAQLQSACIGSANIGVAAVGAAAIAALAVGSAAIGSAAIQSVHIGTAAVLNANIGTISANKITSGTMSANYLTAGSITTSLVNVVDSAGTTVIDGAGLIGAVSFSHGFTEKTSNQDITNTYSDITQLTHSIVTTRTTPVFLYGMFEAVGTSTTAGITATVRIAIVNAGGTVYSNVYPWNMHSGTNLAGDNISQLTVTTSVNLAAGTNTVKVEGKAGYAGTAEFIEDSNFGYIVLGK